MSKYLIYENKETGTRIITKDDMVEYKINKNNDMGWYKVDQFPAGVFMAGDLALDNGFECKGPITENEIFVEML